MTAAIASIQIGRIRTEGDSESPHSMNRRWTTAFYKLSVPGPVQLHPLGVDQDEIADRKHHGGVDKAVLGYAAEHYSAWAAELSPSDFLEPECSECGYEAFGFGAFAENLTISGQTEASVCIGDRYQVGVDEATAVILEVSQPREPCWKISRRWKNKTLTKQVGKTGRTGWYFRVLRAGDVDVGDSFALLDRPHPRWTIARANDILMGREPDRYAVGELMAIPELSSSWKKSLA